MKSRILPSLVAIASVLLAACYPYPENQPNKQKSGSKPNQPPLTLAEQAKLQDQQDAQLRADEEKKKQAEANPQSLDQPKENTLPPADKEKKTDSPKRVDYDFAKVAPGKEGFVLSPYNNKIIDVRDEKTGKILPHGTLVSDPTYPPSEKKYFRVP
ncbi:MAG: hypothetical protein WCP45_06815 [Verrucomicrobiota bacterium]